jgi:hypothetical protein
MTIRALFQTSPKAILLALLLVCSIAIPLNAAHQVVSNAGPNGNPSTGLPYGGASADSTGDETTDDGLPTEIDQILEILISLTAGIQQRLGL